MADENLPPRPKDYWIHRRRMAWASFAGVVAIAVAIIAGLQISHSDLLSDVLWILGINIFIWSGGSSLVDIASKFRR